MRTWRDIAAIFGYPIRLVRQRFAGKKASIMSRIEREVAMINVSMTWSGRLESVTDVQTAWKMFEQAVNGLPLATPRTEIVILVEEDATL